ncbi:MAG TPA: zinc-ribbon domain-containing protein [Candidatus Acidoferrales bacterium]|nr:zinc-ribbon domain-containing protein [Candidatus Acidoferrales bacterium]
MPHCTKCGAAVADGIAFCGSCGAPMGVASGSGAGAAAAPGVAQGQTGLAENAAGALCYALGWITGLIFFFIDKRPYVRFHAAQSIVVFGGLHILEFALGMFFGFGLFGGFGGVVGFGLGTLIYMVLSIGGLILWILLMVKAYQGQRFRVPVAANIAESIFGKTA